MTLKFVVRVHQGGWSYPQLRTVWQEADSLGFHGASLFDVLGTSGLECWTALTSLTAITRRLVAVPLVLSNPYRHPALVAKMAASLGVLSGGRLVLGLGSGGAPSEAEAFGVPWGTTRELASRLEEAVQLMRLLWSGGGSFAGRWYRLRDAPGRPAPSSEGGPPVLIGGHGERYVLPAIARQADIANVGFDLSVEEWRRVRSQIEDHARRAGRDPSILALSHNATVLIGRDGAEVERRVAEWAEARGLSEEDARTRLANGLVGTSEDVVERLRQLERVGVGWVFLLFQDLPRLDSVRLFAETVLPEFEA